MIAPRLIILILLLGDQPPAAVSATPLATVAPITAPEAASVRTPLEVPAAEPLDLTVAVDVASWFGRAGGTVLDPTSTANALTIAQNIKQSFAAFEDDDRNGIEDHRC